MAAAVRLSVFFFIFTVLNLSLSLTDEEILLQFKASFTNGDELLKNWIPLTSACSDEWFGVVCSKGIVTGIHLGELGLAGKVDPTPLTGLRGLRTISLANNTLSGPIPEFNKLGALKALVLSFNVFTGQVPDDYFNQMASLKKVWLSGNQFTGKIPSSLTKLPYLTELHLDNNEFTGPIPDLKHSSLQSVDFSNNKLEGQIPDGLAKFDAKSFAGNDKLCGKPLGKECQTAAKASPEGGGKSPPGSSGSDMRRKMWFFIALVIGVLVLIAVALASARRKEDDFSRLEKEKLGDPLRGQAAVVATSRKKQESSRRGAGSSHGGKNGGGDLVMINEEKPPFGLADLMTAAAEVLGNGAMGSAYKAVMSNGLSVVVKRIKGMNRVGRDTFDKELRRMGKLRHKNILSPLSYHYRKEEKLVVSEHVAKGSLLYVLHGDRGVCHAELTWPVRLKIVKGIACGMGFLYQEYSTYDVAHGNLKSSGILLNDEYEPVLNDYAFYPLINQSNAGQALFACKTPEYVEHQHVSPKSDVYCLGVVILEILTGKFPSQYLNAGKGKGGTDVVEWVHSAAPRDKEAELIDPELTSSAPGSMNQMTRLLKLGVACTEASPGNRPGVKEAIRRIEEVQISDM